MKKAIITIICLILCIDFVDHYFLNNKIYNYIDNYISYDNYKLIINTNALEKSKYYYNEYTPKLKNTTDYIAKNKDDLLNIYYTVLNNDYLDYSFYCDESYTDCIKDVNEIAKDSHIFTSINQFIHPYNSFNTIKSSYNNIKRVDITIDKKYSFDDINKIENKMDEIINNLNINDYSSVKDKIRVFHDYIVNTNEYDKLKENDKSNYHSDSAIGTLFEGFSICSGYSDTLSIFLSKLGLDNVKVITDKHVWNAVKIDDTWYHIDLTWDDPISYTKKDILSHDYFLLTTSELLKKDSKEHNFDKDLYSFLN